MGRTPWFAATLAAVALLVAGCSGHGAGARLEADVAPLASVPATPTKPARAAKKRTPQPAASVVVRTATLTKAIRYRTVTRRDPDLDQGETRVVRDGVPGVLRLTFRVTYTDGRRTARELVAKRTVREPVDRVVAVGTRVAPPAGAGCDPNYTGACVPVDSDVDCAGGSGNGPSYVEGPLRVVGDDVYELDRDGDGIACE
jgi:hypothetical protein